MKKEVWILNHYATDAFRDKGGRHFWMARELQKKGYNPTVFGANTIHNSKDKIELEKQLYKVLEEEIRFVAVRAPEYSGNGMDRILNMIVFSVNLYRTALQYVKNHGKPDVIVASSVHPLTLIVGEMLAKKFGVACICEVRDLWPESIVAYSSLRKESLPAKIMYWGEKKIYQKADAIVMTIEGGKQYVLDRKWEKRVNLDKMHFICNGIVLDEFDELTNTKKVEDEEFVLHSDIVKVVYSGSIRAVNDVGFILDVAKQMQEDAVRFYIYGGGTEKKVLEDRCNDEHINNVVFKGLVDKTAIPYVISQYDICLLHNKSTILDKYGQSQNKLFEYMAAGKPIVQTYKAGYSIIEKHDCGVMVDKQTVEETVVAIRKLIQDKELREKMGQNARDSVKEYDFTYLTSRLIDIIEAV